MGMKRKRCHMGSTVGISENFNIQLNFQFCTCNCDLLISFTFSSRGGNKKVEKQVEIN